MSKKIKVIFFLLLVTGSVSFSKNNTSKLLKPIYFENIKFDVFQNKDCDGGYIEAIDTATGRKVWEYQVLKKEEKNTYLKSMKKIKRELIVIDNLKKNYQIVIPDSIFDFVQIYSLLKKYPQKNRVELEDYFRRKRNGSSIIFEAKIDTFYICGLKDQKQKFGVNYLTKQIFNPKDTFHFIIGHDANFIVKLSNIRYTKNDINLCKPVIFYFSIHSPTQSGINDLNKNTTYTFKFNYYNPTDSTISFNSFATITSGDLNINAAEKLKE